MYSGLCTSMNSAVDIVLKCLQTINKMLDNKNNDTYMLNITLFNP